MNIERVKSSKGSKLKITIKNLTLQLDMNSLIRSKGGTFLCGFISLTDEQTEGRIKGANY